MAALQIADPLSPQNALPMAVMLGVGTGLSVILVSNVESLRKTVLRGSTRETLTMGVFWGLGATTGFYLGACLLQFWKRC